MFELFGNASGQPWTNTVQRRPNPGLMSSGPAQNIDTTDWHRYGLHWEPERIRFFRDGRLVHTVGGTEAAWFNHGNRGTPMGLRINYAMDSRWSGPRTSTAANPAPGWRGEMHVDYIRVYDTIPTNLATGTADRETPAPAPTSPGAPTPPSPPTSPTDIALNTHRDAILRMVEAGVILGYDDLTYRPDRPVTRGQTASLIVRSGQHEEIASVPFSDVVGSTHASAIASLAEAGVITGYPDGTFRPGQAITRAQMASIFQKAFRLPDGDASTFSDIGPGATHGPAIAALVSAGITEGRTPTTFAPDDDVRRHQMASFLDRAIRH